MQIPSITYVQIQIQTWLMSSQMDALC
jgi:hypothetical protein